MSLNRDRILRATDDDADPWHIGNAALYQLCRDHPRHSDERAIIGKLWLIGRTYAAAIERRRPGQSAVVGDRFYTEVVGPAIARSGLDRRLDKLPAMGDPASCVGTALQLHGFLVAEFRQLTGLEKRSLASKYLHFHRPDIFFIYDDRAVKAVRRLRTVVPVRPPQPQSGTDREYSDFFHGVLSIRDHIQSRWKRLLSPRQIDRVFLEIAASEA
jgi:hypothetical protein